MGVRKPKRNSKRFRRRTRFVRQQKRAVYDRYGADAVNGMAQPGAEIAPILAAASADVSRVFWRRAGAAADSEHGGRFAARRRLALRFTLQGAGVTKYLRVPSSSSAKPGAARAAPNPKPANNVAARRETFFGQFVQEAPCPAGRGAAKSFPKSCQNCWCDAHAPSAKSRFRFLPGVA